MEKIAVARASLPDSVQELLRRAEQVFRMRPSAYLVTFYTDHQVIIELHGEYLDAYALARLIAQSPDTYVSVRHGPENTRWQLRLSVTTDLTDNFERMIAAKVERIREPLVAPAEDEDPVVIVTRQARRQFAPS